MERSRWLAEVFSAAVVDRYQQIGGVTHVVSTSPTSKMCQLAYRRAARRPTTPSNTENEQEIIFEINK
eukprot:7009494-Pyramimonas_sp.AAC.1